MHRVDVVAIAAVRATQEALVRAAATKLPSIMGTPAAGEVANGETFDGETEVATFPGDLPTDLDGAVRRRLFQGPLDRCRRQGRLSASCASARRSSTARRRRGAGAASHPPRPRAPVPDRRQAAMTDRTRRPATFRLDDPHVTVMDADEDAGRLARGTIRITPEADPMAMPVVIDEPLRPVRTRLPLGHAVLDRARRPRAARHGSRRHATGPRPVRASMTASAFSASASPRWSASR